MSKTEQARRGLGAFLMQTARGFEFAVAGGTIINAQYTRLRRADGSPVAPYLTWSVETFLGNAHLWAALLAVYGVLLLILLAASTAGDGMRQCLPVRIAAFGLLAFVYLFVSFSVLKGVEPPSVANRYTYTAFLCMCCVAAQVRAYIDNRKRLNIQSTGGA